jgi:hypothetical protein
MKWEPSNPERGGVLGLLDADPTGALPKGATVVDVLAWALSLPGSDDVVTGIVDAVSVELAALAEVTPERRIADVMLMLGRRLDAATLLLKWADNRVKMPTDDDDEETKDTAPDEPPSEDEPGHA